MSQLTNFLQYILERSEHMVAFVPFMFTRYRDGRSDDKLVDIKQIVGWAIMIFVSSLVTAALVNRMTIVKLEARMDSIDKTIVSNQNAIISIISKNEKEIDRLDQRYNDLLREGRRR